MNKQRVISKMVRMRKKPSKMPCMEKIIPKPKDRAKAMRNYIKKIDHGNDGRGYSIKNVIESYYQRKVTGLAS